MTDKVVRWLHISDIHFSPKTSWRDDRPRNELLSYLVEEFKASRLIRPDFIFCTGDIAFGEMKGAPLADQYNEAKKFFDQLRVVCGAKDSPLPIENLFVVPGNHDIDRNLIDSDAQSALNKKAEASRDFVAEINARVHEKSLPFRNSMSRLGAYDDFVKRYLPHQYDTEGRCIYSAIRIVRGVKVGIAGFNSAWSCSGAEDDRHVWLAAEWQFNNAKKGLKDAELCIGLVHHPIDWFTEADRQAAEFQLSTDFDFWLHGHMHNSWVVPVDSHVYVGAGAVSAETKDEFGVNLIEVDLAKGAKVYLHKYARGWTIHPIPFKAPTGVWAVPLPSNLVRRAGRMIEENNSKKIEITNHYSSRKLYGRDALLNEFSARLKENRILLVFGMRGNGKSSIIDALASAEPLVGTLPLRIHASPDMTADDLFRSFAPILGETAEFPAAPCGNAKEISDELLRRYPNPRPTWLWLDRAHVLLSEGRFRSPAVRNLLLGVHMAYGSRWHFILELRERPPQGLLGQHACDCEVAGIDRESMGEYLAASAPPGSDWKYTAKDLKRIYGWIGAGGGKQANPLTVALLIEVARGYHETPIQVLERHSVDFGKKLEESLLDDLINNVLSDDERTMIEVLSLYRKAVPHDHADWLEEKLHINNGWDGLDRRCLLVPDAEQANFYLHSFISSWLRARLGYNEDYDEVEAEFMLDVSEFDQQTARNKQLAIAECWLKQLGGGKRKTRLNVERALEAFYHLTAAGVGDRVPEIAIDLLSGKRDWALNKIAALHNHLFKTKAPVAEQRKSLEFWVVLDPHNPKIRRFLGEAWVKEEGRASAKALKEFEEACRLDPSFGPNWANLGATLLGMGRDGATEFVKRIDEIENKLPDAITETVDAVRANCLEATGDIEGASVVRMNHIKAKSKHSAFYADEAKKRLAQGDVAGALNIVAKAEENLCSNDFISSIYAEALQSDGQSAKASEIRNAKIRAGSRNPTFYAAEANYLLEISREDDAIKLLERAEAQGVWDHVMANVKIKAFRQKNAHG